MAPACGVPNTAGDDPSCTGKCDGPGFEPLRKIELEPVVALALVPDDDE
jgi:hypothetical protein